MSEPGRCCGACIQKSFRRNVGTSPIVCALYGVSPRDRWLSVLPRWQTSPISCTSFGLIATPHHRPRPRPPKHWRTDGHCVPPQTMGLDLRRAKKELEGCNKDTETSGIKAELVTENDYLHLKGTI